MKICSFSHDGMASLQQEDTVMSFFCWGPLQPLRAPHQLHRDPLCAAVGGTGRSWSGHWRRQDVAAVTQGAMVSPCSSAPLQRPGDWGQLERFSPAPGGGNHSTAFPAGSSGTGQGRKEQVICGSRNLASPRDSAGWTLVIFWERSLYSQPNSLRFMDNKSFILFALCLQRAACDPTLSCLTP